MENDYFKYAIKLNETYFGFKTKEEISSFKDVAILYNNIEDGATELKEEDLESSKWIVLNPFEDFKAEFSMYCAMEYAELPNIIKPMFIEKATA